MHSNTKFSLSILSCLLIIFQARAQNKKWELGIQLNSITTTFPYGQSYQDLNDLFYYDLTDTKLLSFSYDFLADKNISDNCLLGLRIGFANIDITQHYDPINRTVNGAHGNSVVIADYVQSQKRTKIAARIAWDFPKDRHSFRIGFDLPYVHYDTFNGHESGISYTDSTYSQAFAILDHYHEVPGGYSVGVGAFLGFKYRIFKDIWVGAEFSSCINYFAFEGTETLTLNTTLLAPSSTTQQEELNYTFSKKGVEYQTVSMSLNVAYKL